MLIVMKKPGNNCGGMMAILESNHLIDYYPILLFYTPPKTSENPWFSDVFRGYKKETLGNRLEGKTIASHTNY